MAYAFEADGTRGTIRFDGEDQNALQFYVCEGPDAGHGFRHILMGPKHPEYLPFSEEGPGHGIGPLDQTMIEAHDVVRAIETETLVCSTFREGLEVAWVVAAT